MDIITDRIHVTTKNNTDIVDLTPQVKQVLQKSGMSEGQVTVFAPGATAGISTIEFEPGLLQDIPERLEAIAPLSRYVPPRHDLARRKRPFTRTRHIHRPVAYSAIRK